MILNFLKNRKGTILKSVYARIIRKPFYLSEHNVISKQKYSLSLMLKYAKKHVPYYKKLLENIDFDNLCLDDFPIVNKHIITKNFDDFTSDVACKYYHMNMYTGGSTGEPFMFLGGGRRV